MGGYGDAHVQGSKHPIYSVDILLRGCRLHLQNCFTFIRIGFNPSFCQIETQKLVDSYDKSTLLGIELHIVLTDSFKYSLEMLSVKCVHDRFHYHIVHIHVHNLSCFFSEDFVHHPLVCCSGIFQPKWHDIVFVIVLLGQERGFDLVGSKHCYLFVPGVGVHEEY